ncbi:MAG: hypothetical protein ACRDZQ_01940 [Acidimicrobiales bacterium]
MALRVTPPWGGQPVAKTVKVDWRGQMVMKQLWSIDVLWYRVCPDAMVRLVVVRSGTQAQGEGA